MNRRSGVVVAIPTYNRKRMLIECLHRVAQQSRPIAGVVVVDNGSTDGTREELAASGIADRLPLYYTRLAVNGGAAGGFHAALEAASTLDAEWIWLFDDDTEPTSPHTLDILLDCPEARFERTAALVPAMHTPSGDVMLLPRGRFGRFVRPLPEDSYHEGAVALDYASYAGMLVRSTAVAAAGLPRAEFYMWFDDVEWTLRLSSVGDCWLIPSAAILHKEDIYFPVRPGLAGTLRMLAQPIPDEQLWKYLYGFRNQTWVRRHLAGLGWRGFAVYLGATCARMLLFNGDKLRRIRWFWEYGLAGWQGRFENATAADWAIAIGRRDARAEIRRRSRHIDQRIEVPLTRVSDLRA